MKTTYSLSLTKQSKAARYDIKFNILSFNISYTSKYVYGMAEFGMGNAKRPTLRVSSCFLNFLSSSRRRSHSKRQNFDSILTIFIRKSFSHHRSNWAKNGPISTANSNWISFLSSNYQLLKRKTIQKIPMKYEITANITRLNRYWITFSFSSSHFFPLHHRII